MNEDTVRNAANGDAGAIAAMVTALSADIDAMARNAARRNPTLSAEDLAQDAWVVALEAIAGLKFSELRGDKVDAARAIVTTAVRCHMLDSVRAERYPGVDKSAMKAFLAALTGDANGDAGRAERAIQNPPNGGKRIGADRARAARLAYVGSASLDAPLIGRGTRFYSPFTVGDTVATAEWDEEAEADAEREARRNMVHLALDDMSELQRDALRYSYGMDGLPCYGTGDGADNDGLAQVLGCGTAAAAQKTKTKAHRSFAKRYVRYAAGSDAEERALLDAADANLGRGGRK